MKLLNKIERMRIRIFIIVASQILLGATFLFSGFVKSVDVYGTSYKIADYLNTFGCAHLHHFATPMAFILITWELMLGISILIGILPKVTSKLSLVTMIFMTLLTLYIAIFNPVDDCGCFGDAFTLSNWGTFVKNLILLICSFLLVNGYLKIKTFISPHLQKIAICYFIVFWGIHLFYNYCYEPIFDFRQYHAGTNLTQVHKSSLKDKIKLVYKKNDIEQTFTESDAPLGDSTWTYVRTEVEPVHSMRKSDIYDFALNEAIISDNKVEYIDITEELFADSDYSYMLVATSLQNLSENDYSKFAAIVSYCKRYEYSVYLLTSDTSDRILSNYDINSMQYIRLCTIDYKTLSTINRTNTGLFVMQQGKILAKWTGNSFQKEDIQSNENHIAEAPSNQSEKRFLMFLLSFVLSVSILKYIDSRSTLIQ